MLTKDKKILIVGLGLIGGSYAQGLSDSGYYVGGLDSNLESINYGINHELIKVGEAMPSKQYISQFDILIFALYPHVFIDWIKEYQEYIKPGAIITDVIGIKSWVIKEISKIIRKDVYYVSTHPMAGREVYGVQNSNKNIFIGANYIITPTEFSDSKSIEVIKNIGEILKFKNITILNEKEHDEMIGFLSQLTHCIAVSLMTCKESTHLVEYTGDSFRDLTRIAKINENMWSELFLLNKEELLSQITLFENQLTKLKKTLENEDIDGMKAMMRQSTINRSYFDK